VADLGTDRGCSEVVMALTVCMSLPLHTAGVLHPSKQNTYF